MGCLIASGVDPRSILLLTFSRRAAVNVPARRRHHCPARRTLGSGGDTALPSAGTFHGVAARCCVNTPSAGAQSGIHDPRSRGRSRSARSRPDRAALSDRKQRFPQKATCLAIYSSAVNTRRGLDRVLAEDFSWCATWESELRALFAAYVEAKQRQGVLDYDDLLLYWSQLMAEPALGAEIGQRLSHMLVDEYQDTNRLQASILLALKPDGRGLTAVGDDAQAIYAFRGATVRNILDYPGEFHPPRASSRVAELSVDPIDLDAANAVIGLAPERFTKECE